jgi:phosphatidylcholine synthase
LKTKDNWFRGFPALWNCAVLYLFVLRLPWIASAALLIFGTAAMFIPVVFVHPLRVVKLRWVTIAVTIAFFGLASAALLQDLMVGWQIKTGFVLVAAYFLALPLVRHSPWAD